MLLFSPPPNSVPLKIYTEDVRVCGKQTSASFFSLVFLLFSFSSLVLVAFAHNRNIKENVKNYNAASARNVKIRLKLNLQTNETISDSAECYVGLSVRFESSAACM